MDLTCIIALLFLPSLLTFIIHTGNHQGTWSKVEYVTLSSRAYPSAQAQLAPEQVLLTNVLT